MFNQHFIKLAHLQGRFKLAFAALDSSGSVYESYFSCSIKMFHTSLVFLHFIEAVEDTLISFLVMVRGSNQIFFIII